MSMRYMDSTWIKVRYQGICDGPSVALALLALWERPWSSNAMRFAYHALHRAYRRGLDVLEGGNIQ